MHNKELLKEILAEKDPETLIRKVRNLPVRKVSALSYSDEFVAHVGGASSKHPEIKNRIQNEENTNG